MIVFGKDVEMTVLGGGVSRKILAQDTDMMAVEVHFETGAVGAVHTHPHVQISYVLAGKFEFELDGVKTVIGVGDTYYTKPNAPHGVVCLEAGVLLDVFTPRREDFLK